MNNELKEVRCHDLSCGFMVRSRSETELIEDLKAHAKIVHRLDASDEKIKAKIKPAEST